MTGPQLIPTTTVLTSTPNPSHLNQVVTMTATVSAQNGSTPAGSVVFQSDGAGIGTVALNSGTAVLDYSRLAARHAITWLRCIRVEAASPAAPRIQCMQIVHSRQHNNCDQFTQSIRTGTSSDHYRDGRSCRTANCRRARSASLRMARPSPAAHRSRCRHRVRRSVQPQVCRSGPTRSSPRTPATVTTRPAMARTFKS